MPGKKHDKITTVTGIVTASKWGKDNQVTGVSIFTDGEKEYFVIETPSSQELFSRLRQEVQVTGIVHKGDDGMLMIEMSEDSSIRLIRGKEVH